MPYKPAHEEFPKLEEMTKQTAQVSSAALLGTTLWGDFFRSTPDAAPGWNYTVIDGLPAGTRFVSVWMTEWTGSGPHAGSSIFNTASVQLFNGGTQCRIIYRLNGGSSLPPAIQLIYG
jgi:hypothetical protein